jgi:hypothetical protein
VTFRQLFEAVPALIFNGAAVLSALVHVASPAIATALAWFGWW